MPRKPTGNPNGRPPIDFDWEILDNILRYKPSLEDCAELMKCHYDTIQNKIREKYGVTFSQYREKKMAHTRLTLTQKAIQMATSGNVTMMIFCLKNLCGWCDQPQVPMQTEDEAIISDIPAQPPQ